jgi:hypothetical protein
LSVLLRFQIGRSEIFRLHVSSLMLAKLPNIAFSICA